VLRHRETGKYYAGSGEWASEATEAFQFDGLPQVLAEAQKYGLQDCCEFMMGLSDKPGVSIAVPI